MLCYVIVADICSCNIVYVPECLRPVKKEKEKYIYMKICKLFIN